MGADVKRMGNGRYWLPHSISNYTKGALLLFCDDAPLLKDLVIVSPQTIDALDYQGVVLFYFSDKALVILPFEVLSRLLINKKMLILYTELMQCYELALFVLFLCRYSCISIYHFY